MRWLIHNCVGHPLMGICQLFGFEKLGDFFHEATLPRDEG